jgi:hypothetical protein
MFDSVIITLFFLCKKTNKQKVVIIWLMMMTRRTLTASVSPVANSKATTVTVYRKKMNQMIDRLACPPGNGQREPPVNRVNTSQRLEMLRKAMTLSKVDSYIITGDDEHQVFHSTVIGFFFSNDSAFDD